MDSVFRTSLYKTCKIWKPCQAWCSAFRCTMDSLDLLTSGTGFSGGRINHQFTCVLGESSWLLFPKSTCLFQVHTLYFNSFLSFCKLKSYMQDYVTLEHSKNTKGKLQTFILRYPSPWAEGSACFSWIHSISCTPILSHIFLLLLTTWQNSKTFPHRNSLYNHMED